MKQLINRIFILPVLAHEFCHYIPAAVFGLHPVIDSSWRKMRHVQTSGVRRLIILLSPCLVGLLGLSLSLIHTGARFITSSFNDQIILAALYAFWFAWLAACRIDICKAYDQLKGKQV